MKKILALFLVVAPVSFFWRQYATIPHPPGILISMEPEQILFTNPQPPIYRNGWTLKPLALYIIEARVLSKERYTNDSVASLAPYDLALGWGRMSDTAVLERLDISQSNRFYHWQCWGNTPIPEKEMISHSANNHLIPADDSVRDQIAALRVGALVKISGFLVEATHPQANHPWRSSLSREDTGDGACEIIYVRVVQELPEPN